MCNELRPFYIFNQLDPKVLNLLHLHQLLSLLTSQLHLSDSDMLHEKEHLLPSSESPNPLDSYLIFCRQTGTILKQ